MCKAFKKKKIRVNNLTSSGFCQSWLDSSLLEQRASRKAQSAPDLTVAQLLELIKVKKKSCCIVMNMYVQICTNISLFQFPHADSTIGRGAERGGGVPLPCRWSKSSGLCGPACIGPCVPKPCKSILLRFEHPGTASAHPVPLSQVYTAINTPQGVVRWYIFSLLPPKEFFIFTNSTNWIVYLYNHGTSSPSSWPQQCVSRPRTSGSGEKGLLFVSALSPVFSWHPWSCHVCLP